LKRRKKNKKVEQGGSRWNLSGSRWKTFEEYEWSLSGIWVETEWNMGGLKVEHRWNMSGIRVELIWKDVVTGGSEVEREWK